MSFPENLNEYYAQQPTLPFDLAGFELQPFQIGQIAIPRYNSLTVIEAELLELYWKENSEESALEHARDFNATYALILLWSRHSRAWDARQIKRLPMEIVERLAGCLLEEATRSASKQEDASEKKPDPEATTASSGGDCERPSRKKRDSVAPGLATAQSA